MSAQNLLTGGSCRHRWKNNSLRNSRVDLQSSRSVVFVLCKKLLSCRRRPCSDFSNRRIRQFIQRRVLRVVMLDVWIVVLCVVTTNQAPPRIVAKVRIRAVQQVRVEEQRRAGGHLAVDKVQNFHRSLQPCSCQPHIQALQTQNHNWCTAPYSYP